MSELPVTRQRGGEPHYFQIVTPVGVTRRRFDSLDAAREVAMTAPRPEDATVREYNRHGKVVREWAVLTVLTTIGASEGPEMPERADWGRLAKDALERALDEVESGRDAISTVSLALDCLRAEVGELPQDTLECLEALYAEPECICPPDLVARGGFKGGCPIHG